ncbi:MAG: hypothetical protein AAFP82_19605, partial [Bacteroidota bacterium]
EKVKQKLMQQSWQRDYQKEDESLEFKELWTFEEEQLVRTTYYTLDENILYAEKEYHCWTISQYDQYFFLTWYGHKDSCNSPFSTSEQILQLNNDQLLLSDCLGATWRQQNFTSTNNIPDFPSEDYKVCYHYISQYYYRPTANGRSMYYEGGLRAILKEAKSEYEVPKNSNGQSGWVRIRFVVNCDGQLGRFSIQEIDSNIQPKRFDPQITTQLFKIVQELKDYHPRIDGDQLTRDDYKHITFKLIDGEIIEILP